MSLPLALAHRRYVQQAGWTAQLRRHIFSRAGLPNARRVLEIGCGTGAVLATIARGANANIYGVDLDFPSLRIAEAVARNAVLIAADGHQLPFPDECLDISFFHFVLLWLSDPVRALSEARRVTRPGGVVIAFAEPDYSQRITKSPTLAKIGRLQADSLHAHGANPNLGGQLVALLARAGIQPVESGQLQFDPSLMDGDAFDLELEVLKSDLVDMISGAELRQLLGELREIEKDFATFQVPTFYCWGRVQ